MPEDRRDEINSCKIALGFDDAFGQPRAAERCDDISLRRGARAEGITGTRSPAQSLTIFETSAPSCGKTHRIPAAGAARFGCAHAAPHGARGPHPVAESALQRGRRAVSTALDSGALAGRAVISSRNQDWAADRPPILAPPSPSLMGRIAPLCDRTIRLPPLAAPRKPCLNR